MDDLNSTRDTALDRTDSDLEIILPSGDIDAHNFQTEVQFEATAAIRQNRLRLPTLQAVQDLTVQAMLTARNALLSGTDRIAMDIVSDRSTNAFLERLKRPVKVALHRLALYYVNKLAAHQHRVNVQIWEILAALEKRERLIEHEQKGKIDELQAEIVRLRSEIQEIKSARTG